MDLGFRIKGKLLQNRSEKDLSATLYKMDFTLLMHQLFYMRGYKYRNWKKEDWVCKDCAAELFTDTLPFWWLDYKRKGKLNFSLYWFQ
jgi:hypothetical protein